MSWWAEFQMHMIVSLFVYHSDLKSMSYIKKFLLFLYYVHACGSYVCMYKDMCACITHVRLSVHRLMCLL